MKKDIKVLVETYQKELKKEMAEIKDKTVVGAFHDHADVSYENIKPSVTVCIDFDGTMVEHEYPYIGPEAEGCVETLTRWINDYNVGIILDTMRSGEELQDAIDWCNERGIKLYGVGCDPTQKSWTSSPKAYAPFSIDDRNIGCPLVYGKSKRPYVDWKKVNKLFEPILKSF